MMVAWMMLAILAASEPQSHPVDDLSRPARALVSPASWVTADDYPPAALRAGAQGQVEVLVRILPNGRVGVSTAEQKSASVAE